MTKEQDAIEKLTNGEKIDFNTLVRTFKKEGIQNFVVTKKEYIEIVLDMLKEKEALYHKALSDLVKADRENIRLKKQIDLMSEMLVGITYYDYKDKNIEKIFNSKEEVKQYFERKSKE